MTVSDPNPGFKVTVYLEVEYLKDKLLLHNRKLYVKCGMVLCLLTLIDR